MIHAICDFCGKDTDRTATLLSMTPFQNFARYNSDSKPYGSRDETKSFVICNECMEKRDLPNPHHDYLSITGQNMKYEKCIDNYSEEDFIKDIRKGKAIKGGKGRNGKDDQMADILDGGNAAGVNCGNGSRGRLKHFTQL